MIAEGMLTLDEATTLFLNRIESKVSTALYNAWFKNMQIMDLDTTALIYIDSDFKKKKILDNQAYIDIIEETLKEVTGKDYSFELLTDTINNELLNANYEEKITISEPVENIKQEIISENTYVNNDNDINKEYRNLNSNLDPDLTFDNYMITKNINEGPQVVALEVAKNPGKSYNPFFIYGNSGTGKTHLMMAIGNYIVKNSDKTVLYVSSGDFIKEFIEMTRKTASTDFSLFDHFKDKYRNVDVLIIDDIQMMAEAKQTQNELFDTLDVLKRLKKQIIISSDKAPSELNKFDSRLITRFSEGIAIDIKPPDKELKIKILKNKTIGTYIGSIISDDVYEYIAINSPADARSLNTAINRLIVNATLYQPTVVDVKFAQEALGDVFGSTQYLTNNLARIRKTVADYYDVTEESLKSKKRKAQINKARQVAIYISSILTEETTIRIGLEYNRDHATVLHACKEINKDLSTDKTLENEIKEIKDLLTE